MRTFQGQQLERWELEPLHLVLLPSTLQPAKAKPNQELRNYRAKQYLWSEKQTDPPPGILRHPGVLVHLARDGHIPQVHTKLLAAIGTVCSLLLLQAGFTCRMQARQVSLWVLICHFYSWEEKISEQLQDFFIHCHSKVTSEEIRNWSYT